jgi:acetolactate synthase-1/2/3 large subunit
MTIIILNNNSYGMIQRKQVGQDFDEWGMELKNPDFVMLAQSFGASYADVVSDTDDFAKKLTHALMTP